MIEGENGIRSNDILGQNRYFTVKWFWVRIVFYKWCISHFLKKIFLFIKIIRHPNIQFKTNWKSLHVKTELKSTLAYWQSLMCVFLTLLNIIYFWNQIWIRNFDQWIFVPMLNTKTNHWSHVLLLTWPYHFLFIILTALNLLLYRFSARFLSIPLYLLKINKIM